jgi:hypothetical protein
VSTGSCRCGAVRFEADGAPLVTMACHCRGCQRMSASAFSLSSLFPADRFRLTQGETVRGGLRSGPDHRFCASCMSWLYTVPEGLEEFVNVRSPMFEDAAEHRPFIETFTSERLGWAVSGAERSYDAVPGEAEFGGLMEAYAAWDGRVKA